MIDEDGHICLADFGLAKILSKEISYAMTFAGVNILFNIIIKTPIYLAPEMIDTQTYSKEIDWWALGITM